MTRGIVLAFCAFALLFSTTGCYIAKVEAPGARHIMSMSPVAGSKVADLNLQYRNWYSVLGLIPWGQPDVRTDVEKEIAAARGRSVANLKVETGFDIISVVLNIIPFLNLVVETTYTNVTGDILK